MTRLFFDRARVDSLRLALGATLDELRAIRSTDAAAAEEMRTIAGARRTVEEIWLPRILGVLDDTSMTSCTRSALGQPDISQAARFVAANHPGWEVATDPLVVLGPPAPRQRNFDEVFADMKSGALRPMDAPLDAHGRANAHYTSLAFAPSTPPQELGRLDLTSNAAKVADFLSDALTVGWHEEATLVLYHLDNARVTKSFHSLTAYDREDGPETSVELTEVAVISGYMAIWMTSTEAEVTMDIGEGDPTASAQVASQSSSSYAGGFYPDDAQDFQPMTHEDRFESPDRWTFTTSASPMVDEWGTWHV